MSIAVTANPVEPEWTAGDRILRARKHAKLEQSQVADALGVSRALVSMWERDLSEPRVSQLKKLAEICGVSQKWLLGFSESGYKQILRSVDDVLTDPFQTELHFEPRPALSSLR